MIAVVDLFAGPGGLGEGFSSVADDESNGVFQIVMSVENNPFAHKTLRLRSFLRKILTAEGKVPPEYLEFMAEPNEKTLGRMTSLHEDEWQAANDEALLETLDKNDDSLAFRAKRRLDKLSPDAVVLIGGPPCQAYSLVGRARRTNFTEEAIENDARQTLYQCYLKFIEVITPDVFVMENVQGILSARHAGHGVFGRIVSDMESLGYTINSLVTEDPQAPADYLVRAEQYGVPQARHRVILLGTKSSNPQRPNTLIKPNKTVTVGMALSGLPKLRSGFSMRDGTPQDKWASYLRAESKALAEEVDDEEVSDKLLSLCRGRFPERQMSATITKQSNYYREWYRGRLGASDILTGHESRTHLSKDLSRYLYCSAFAAVKRSSPTLYDSFSSTTRSRSHMKAAVAPFCLDTTVSLLHWEKEAVFMPSPNLPKSVRSRACLGSRLPILMESSSSSLLRPAPLSIMPTAGEGTARASICISVAPADRELSTISASAVLKV